ncbi:MAG TPA: GspE/PulE family protein [Pelomicrobium sp.]|nr:GspE/PulE family protein [Pelomicrobium sp.]
MNLSEKIEGVSIAPAALGAAREEARRTGRPVLEMLETALGLPQEQFIASLAVTLHCPALAMGDLHELAPAFDVIAFADASHRGCIPFRDGEGCLRVALGDPFAPAVRAWVEEHVQEAFTWYLAHPSDIAAYLSRYEESVRAMDGVLAGGAREADAEDGAVESLSLASISEDTSPVVRLVNSTLYDALKSYASDIHVESTASGLTLKYRMDGVLVPVGSVQGVDIAEQVISRIKVMAELDIAERRIPQDGRFKVAVKGRGIDFRVSIMPSIFGEDAVLRILDKQALADQVRGLRLDYLGFDAPTIAALRKLCNEPYGMVLVTGPTGSGKTTTLYAVISEINSGQDKIVTIEDPVEYQLSGVLQIPVNEKKGLTFARGLRSILRHDPDKIMVGEIRDPETAQIAVQAALTGHLVFTTVHANNVFDVIGRFAHMGVDPYAFVSAMNGIAAQRLVRLVCPDCAADDRPADELLRASGLEPEKVADFRFRTGRGCGKCRGTGYRGRKALAELLQLNDEIRELIVKREPVRALRKAAAKNGTHFLRQAALECVRAGETTLQEINRVTFVE